MSRNVLFLSLLLAVGIVLAASPPEAEQAAPADKAQAQPAEADESATAPAEKPAKPAEADESADGGAEAQDKTEGDATGMKKKTQDGPQEMSGMSVLGNREAPKALVIVPWKSSQIGDTVGISTMLDDSRQPVDREEFMRELSYYEIRSEGTP